jgi:DNA-binding NtrC family response regulator
MSLQKKNILVLDSDPAFLIALEHVLEEEGFNTLTTWNAWEANALLGSSRFDVLLVGEHPPEVKSGEFLNQVQVGHRRIPCIVMQSAARHPFEAQFLYARGAYAVTPKWNHKGIVEQVRQSLRHSDSTINDTRAGEQSSFCA